jgi:hypothetical protein
LFLARLAAKHFLEARLLAAGHVAVQPQKRDVAHAAALQQVSEADLMVDVRLSAQCGRWLRLFGNRNPLASGVCRAKKWRLDPRVTASAWNGPDVLWLARF